jgi:sugar/nucleoside kinase (ribokinase family)
MEMLLSRYPAEAVVITRGGRVSVLLTRDHEISVGTAHIPLGELYPVGAGDDFAAGVLLGLTLGWDH